MSHVFIWDNHSLGYHKMLATVTCEASNDLHDWPAGGAANNPSQHFESKGSQKERERNKEKDQNKPWLTYFYYHSGTLCTR